MNSALGVLFLRSTVAVTLVAAACGGYLPSTVVPATPTPSLEVFRAALKVYIDQTIPVLETHLKMAESLGHDDKVLGSAENPANNKAAN